MVSFVNIEEFISIISSENSIVLDVRSESEFIHGHIPGSVNLPLLNNEQRAIVGTVYKNEGREAAVEKGFELRGATFSEIITRTRELSAEKKIMVYCWRGGMRSSIVSWILNLTGYDVIVLNKGYKSFRWWVLNKLNEPLKLIVLGGKTGSGKTEILRLLADKGEQIIDLELLANHKGSTFGGLGQPPQPANEHFENGIAWQLFKCDLSKPIWIENESRLIGKNLIPGSLYSAIQNSAVIELEVDYELRLEKIINEYGKFPVEDLIDRTKKVAKRLGGLRLKQALNFLDINDIKRWAEIMIDYYDSLYNFSSNIKKNNIYKYKLDTTNFKCEVLKIIEFKITILRMSALKID